MWQDYVITVVQVVFAIALVPTIMHPTQKPPISSCIITTLGMATLACTYLSLKFWYSTALATIITVEWLTVWVQRYRINKKDGSRATGMPLGKWIDIILMR